METPKRNNKRSPEAKKRRRKARRKAEVQATPKWVDRSKLKSLKAKARELTEKTGIVHSLDHIVPIRHPLVCGLNVPANLTIMPAYENSCKGNDFTPGRIEL